jgi:quinol monooxygenase YgiN
VFIISGTMTFDPAKHDEIAEAMRKIVAITTGEEGSLTYTFTASLETPGTFRIFEHWASQEAFDRHCQTPHYLEFIGSVGQWGMSGADVNRYEVPSYASLTGG